MCSKCTVTVEASFSPTDSPDRRERHESRKSSTYGTYIYHPRHSSRRDRPDRLERGCRCDHSRQTHARQDRHRCYEGDEPRRSRSCGDEYRVMLEVVDRTAPGTGQCHYASRRQQSYSIHMSVRTATEEVMAHLVTDPDIQEVRVHWRDGDTELLHRSISVAALASHAVYLEVRNRPSSCHCC